MFDLEQSIMVWRKQMQAAGIALPALSELESHLREDIEKQVKSGKTPQSAFEMATKSIGRGAELKKEFKKAGEPLVARLVKLMGIGCWTISFMLSLWFLRFVFYQTELIPIILGLVAVATSILCWRYSSKLLPAIRHKAIRTVIGFACCVAGVVWIQLFIKDIAPGLMQHPAGMDVAVGRLIATMLWASTAMAILSAIGYGLERAARERETTDS